MPSQYCITEPHPTANTYLHSGRGGAGNTFRAPKNCSDGITARGPASALKAGLPASSSKFSAGRGGAGNIRAVSERPVFSFEDELERQNTRERKMKDGGVWHVGRGGAGNFTTSSVTKSARKDSTSSAASDASARSGFFGRLSNTLERR